MRSSAASSMFSARIVFTLPQGEEYQLPPLHIVVEDASRVEGGALAPVLRHELLLLLPNVGGASGGPPNILLLDVGGASVGGPPNIPLLEQREDLRRRQALVRRRPTAAVPRHKGKGRQAAPCATTGGGADRRSAPHANPGAGGRARLRARSPPGSGRFPASRARARGCAVL
eukprot:gene5719-biopygen1093